MRFRPFSLLAGLVTSLCAGMSTQASADALYHDIWLPGTTVGGAPLVGGFVYDATTGAVFGDTSSIPGFCSGGACGLSIFAQNALSLSGADGGFLQVAFNAGPTFKTIGSNPILFVDNAGAPGFFPPGIIPSTGSLNVSLAPSPTPGVGLASVFVLAGALFWSRRLRGEKQRS